MSTTRFGIATPGAAHPAAAQPTATQPPAVPLRRRRWRVVAALVCVAVAVGGAFWVGRVTSPAPPPAVRTPVLVTTVALPAGAAVTASDLRLTTVAAGTAPAGALDPARRAAATAERASRALPAGTLLTAADLTTRPYPAAGQALVGVQLSPAEAPAGALTPGARVVVVVVPAAGQPPYPAPRSLTAATVWSSAPDSNGTAVVITLPAGLAATVAGAAAHDEVSLVLPGG